VFRGLGLIASLAVVASLAPVNAAADAAERPVVVGGVSGVAGADQTGDLAPQSPVHVQLVLRRQNQAELDALARRPASPRLAVGDLRARFSPSQRIVDAATGFLRSHGFAAITVSADRTLVDADAPAGVVQAALGTHLARYRDRTGGRTFRTNVSAPVLPAWLAAHVESVHGLDDRPAARRHVSTGPSGGYTPAQIKALYSLHNAPLGSTDGAGQTIGLLEFTNYNAQHILAYDMQYYPAPSPQPPPPQTVLIPGGVDTRCCGNQVESELDIEVIQAIAPQATIKVYEAPNTDAGENAAFNRMISDGVNVISTSWGQCEQLTQFFDPNELGTLHGIFQSAAAAGINVYAATGDAGAYDCRDMQSPNQFNDNLAVDSPASDPNVIGVGGTTLFNAGDNVSYASEVAWSANNVQGGGGGLSRVYTAPPWQALDGTGNGMRQVPDVSFDADPNSGVSVFTYKSGDSDLTAAGGWGVVGGTSVGSPAWAAFNALYNQYSKLLDQTSMELAGPTLYAAAACHGSPAPFHDVTTGNNLRYNAGGGFDLASGWGTMNGSALASTIKGQSSAALQVTSVSPNQGFTAGGARVNVFGCGFRHSGTTTPTVTFNGAAASGVTWINSAQLVVTIPPGPARAVTVAVTNPGGGAPATLPAGFTYVTPPPPPPPGPPPPAGGTNLYGTLLNGGSSGAAELHGLSQQVHYSDFMLHAATAFGSVPTADWRFFVAPYGGDGRPDLVGLHLRGTASGRVEVHVLSAASGYQGWLLHTATPLAAVSPGTFQFALGSLDGDGRSDLFAIGLAGTGSGTVEVHALSDGSGYNSWVLHSATALGTANANQWQFRIGDRGGRGDLVGVLHSGTGSGNTEVHALSRDSGYQGFTIHAATPLEQTTDSQFAFVFGDHDSDGVPDLYAVKMNGTGSGRTEVHVLSGRAGYTDWNEHAITAMDTTSGSNWEFSAR
jgi:kumamolisin